MTDLRDKIARALAAQTTCDGGPHPSELHFRQADAVLAALDVEEIRAEALRDAAEVLIDALPESPSAAQTGRMKFAIGFLYASAANPQRKENR